MPRDLVDSTTTSTVVQVLADSLIFAWNEFNRLDGQRAHGEVAEEYRDAQKQLRDLCNSNVSSYQVRILTQFPKSAADAVTMLALARGYIDPEECVNAVWSEIARGAIERATAFLIEHFGMAGTDLAEFCFGEEQRDRALGRGAKVRQTEREVA